MKTIHLRCDCGCGKTGVEPSDHKSEHGSGWFELSQHGIPNDGEFRYTGPRIERTLHFSSLNCLLSWTSKAIEASTKNGGQVLLFGDNDRFAPVHIENVTGLVLG